MDPEVLDDIEVIERILKGNKVLYETVVRRYNPYLYKVGRSYDYSHEDTQDLMQETFIDAFKGLSGFRRDASFKTWIVRIMLNNCYRKRQKLSFIKELAREVKEGTKPIFMDTQRETGQVVRNHELKKIIENALNDIPLKYRLVFTLREVNGMNVRDTADALDISEANVKVRLNRGKKKLRAKLEESYSKVELFEFNLVYCDGIVKRVMKEVNKL